MKPALVMNDFNPAGAERLVKDLAFHMAQYRYINPVVIVANKSGELQSKFDKNNIDYVNLGIDVSMSTVPKGAIKLATTLEGLNVDLVHSHLAFPDLVSRISCSLMDIPHISTYHSVMENRIPLKNIVERATWRLSDHIICVSEAVRQSYGNRNKMSVIYNGIDIRDFNQRVSEADISDVKNGAEKGDTVFVNIGRCVRVKQQRTLIEAVDEMADENIHLYIIGDGPLKSNLEQLAIKSGVSDQVTLTGYIDDVTPYLAFADAFVSSSLMEGLPTTHLEAMAAELPIISTKIPGVQEVIQHGETGFLYPVDDPTKLASYMSIIHNDGSATLGHRGFKVALSTFSIETVVEEHLQLYRTMLDMTDKESIITGNEGK